VPVERGRAGEQAHARGVPVRERAGDRGDVAVGELDEYVTARGAVHLARERLWKTLLDSEGPLPPLERAALLA